ncbi:GerAB/ArcD/ProY family transporter [Aquibacillus salsiterrae]|uniref:Endospore germination permease n=1 Tax=Aquibacillus salsiterrae TaxID=2950439 RepID=A0A9X3WHW2_9BACI|nr:endospore germination permease [Aquibacillus salsiterrae]MDC3417749.1 endospore germination permease [Aquibacillus salsiterrae]
MKPDKTLKTREMFAIVALFIGVKLSDTTATLYSQKVQNGFWLSVVVSLIIALPSFFILLHLLKLFKDKNLVELLEILLGKFIGKVVGFTIFLTSFGLLVLDSRNYVEEVKLLYFPESPTTSLYFIFIIVCILTAKRGLESIGSTSWIVLPFIKISMFLLAFLILKEIVWLRIFPIFGNGLDVVLTEGINKASIFSEFILLTIAYTSFRDTKFFRRGSYIGSSVVSLELVFFFLLYALVFDYNSIEKVAYPYHEVTQYVNLGNFFTNVETFFMVFWLSAAFLRFIIYLYLVAMVFGAVFNIKEHESLLLPLGLLTVSSGLLVENTVINELVYREKLLMYSTPLYVLLPYLLWIIKRLRRDLK